MININKNKKWLYKITKKEEATIIVWNTNNKPVVIKGELIKENIIEFART